MTYLLPAHRADELGPDREPTSFISWPERAVLGDRIHLRERGANLKYRVGDRLDGPHGEVGSVVEMKDGSAMFFATAIVEVVALPFQTTIAPYQRSRLSDVGE